MTQIYLKPVTFLKQNTNNFFLNSSKRLLTTGRTYEQSFNKLKPLKTNLKPIFAQHTDDLGKMRESNINMILNDILSSKLVLGETIHHFSQSIQDTKQETSSEKPWEKDIIKYENSAALLVPEMNALLNKLESIENMSEDQQKELETEYKKLCEKKRKVEYALVKLAYQYSKKQDSSQAPEVLFKTRQTLDYIFENISKKASEITEALKNKKQP